LAAFAFLDFERNADIQKHLKARNLNEEVGNYKRIWVKVIYPFEAAARLNNI
jgi:hypothetical protein